MRKGSSAFLRCQKCTQEAHLRLLIDQSRYLVIRTKKKIALFLTERFRGKRREIGYSAKKVKVQEKKSLEGKMEALNLEGGQLSSDDQEQEKNPPGVQGGSDAGRFLQGRIGLVDHTSYPAWVRQVTTDTTLDTHTRVIILAYGASATLQEVLIANGDKLEKSPGLVSSRVPKELCEEIGVSTSKYYRAARAGDLEGRHMLELDLFEYETASKTATAPVFVLRIEGLEKEHFA